MIIESYYMVPLYILSECKIHFKPTQQGDLRVYIGFSMEQHLENA